MKLLVWPLLATLSLQAAGVVALFDPADPASGPYPSDALTVLDPNQKTSLRVTLPPPACATDRIGCILQPALNRLDGFNLQPRILVRFSAPIFPDSFPNGVFFVALATISTSPSRLP